VIRLEVKIEVIDKLFEIPNMKQQQKEYNLSSKVMELKIFKYLHSESKFLTFFNIFHTLVAEEKILSFCFQDDLKIIQVLKKLSKEKRTGYYFS
jgi:hypothetical protein